VKGPKLRFYYWREILAAAGASNGNDAIGIRKNTTLLYEMVPHVYQIHDSP
jgi:hypothetical protein